MAIDSIHAASKNRTSARRRWQLRNYATSVAGRFERGQHGRYWPDPEAPTDGPAGPLPEVDLPCKRSEWHGSF
jgi:hypothetical protein